MQFHPGEPSQPRPVLEEPDLEVTDWLLPVPGSWAEVEFGGAGLGDIRRRDRLVRIAHALAARPSSSIPSAMPEMAEWRGCYRFFDNPNVTAEAILAPHIQATHRRLQLASLTSPAEKLLVLGVQDTCYLDFTTHPATTDLGPLSVSSLQGLVMHTTLAMLPEGVPLGLLGQEVWARDPECYGQGGPDDHRRKPSDQKESFKWIQGFRAACRAREQCPEIQFLVVGDRESDVFELFAQERQEGMDLLVRGCWDRRVDHPERYLWSAMATTPVSGTLTLKVPARKAPLKTVGSKQKVDRAARVAQLELHFTTLHLKVPTSRRGKRLPDVPLQVVWAVEKLDERQPKGGLPEGVERIEWMLLTTMPVNSVDDAIQVLQWYCCRWGIEIWHKVLKSGCKFEQRQLQTAQRLQRLLPVLAVIAWRIHLAAMISRTTPEVSCTLLLEEMEWKALYCAIHKVKEAPAEPPPVGEAVRWIARLGGFLGRKGDGHPGVTTLWRGMAHLADLTEMYRIMTDSESLYVGSCGSG